MLLEEKAHKIIQAFYKVYNTLGYVFLEKGYQKALIIELGKIGFACREEVPIKD